MQYFQHANSIPIHLTWRSAGNIHLALKSIQDGNEKYFLDKAISVSQYEQQDLEECFAASLDILNHWNHSS